MALFVSFEGIDGSGKSTQAKLLATALTRRGIGVVLTREPGSTYIGERVRTLFTDPECSEIDPLCELLLALANRVQHLEEVVRPALSQGKVVITDPYIDSTFAYQGYGRGLDLQLIEQLQATIAGEYPHVTYLLDIDPCIALARKVKGIGRMELLGRQFLDKVRHGFLQVASANPTRIRVIEGTLPIDRIHEQMLVDVLSVLASRTGGRLWGVQSNFSQVPSLRTG